MGAPPDTEVLDRLYSYLQGDARYAERAAWDRRQAAENNEKDQRDIALIFLFDAEEREPIQEAYGRGDVAEAHRLILQGLEVKAASRTA